MDTAPPISQVGKDSSSALFVMCIYTMVSLSVQMVSSYNIIFVYVINRTVNTSCAAAAYDSITS